MRDEIGCWPRHRPSEMPKLWQAPQQGGSTPSSGQFRRMSSTQHAFPTRTSSRRLPDVPASRGAPLLAQESLAQESLAQEKPGRRRKSECCRDPHEFFNSLLARSLARLTHSDGGSPKRPT